MNLQLKNNRGLVQYCEAQLGKPYWYGCFGQLSSQYLYEMKKRQYPRYYTANDFKDQMGVKVHDCIGLIKGYMWCHGADDAKPVYVSNGFSDWSADSFYSHCKRKSNVMATMPDIPGIAVFMKGHVGVYVGGGEVIEARGHKYGIVRTKLSERRWQRWAYIDEIQYL